MKKIIVVDTGTTLCDIHKKELNKRGFKDFRDWNNQEHTLYIGRNMNFYVKGAIESKWKNPFSVKTYGLEKCLELYEEYIRETPELEGSLGELDGKELGCWCSPKPCHGDVLIKLLEENK